MASGITISIKVQDSPGRLLTVVAHQETLSILVTFGLQSLCGCCAFLPRTLLAWPKDRGDCEIPLLQICGVDYLPGGAIAAQK